MAANHYVPRAYVLRRMHKGELPVLSGTGTITFPNGNMVKYVTIAGLLRDRLIKLDSKTNTYSLTLQGQKP